MGADYVGRPEPRRITMAEYETMPVPRGYVHCVCKFTVRLRVNGAITKHNLPSGRFNGSTVCPMSGTKAESGARL